MNVVAISGRITSDPELKQTQEKQAEQQTIFGTGEEKTQAEEIE